ncbi:tripartite tricarboxylate transporter TctB family protein [Halomonas sp. M4R5S39]|uniref:tripartite tricarboxylate transporter TctB family protein n=1 Tax=Halomonas kalidii TaxID=3043293 RepID=UPI0024A86881|nr:tripartite tricarboxylate transporter TctB family protein [Halomonas kalidii]MDI5985456.1 tripartite tricarboxylate transporter TctB family protein [Halomonas kalidii]
MNYRDLFSGIAFLIIGTTTAWMGKDFFADAAYIPIGAGTLMGLFSLPLIWRSSRSLLARRPSSQPAMALVDHSGRFLATLGCCLVYYVALPTVGFYTTSALFIILLAPVLGERRPVVVLGITLGFITLLYGLFAVVLKRPLPVEFFLAS